MTIRGLLILLLSGLGLGLFAGSAHAAVPGPTDPSNMVGTVKMKAQPTPNNSYVLTWNTPAIRSSAVIRYNILINDKQVATVGPSAFSGPSNTYIVQRPMVSNGAVVRVTATYADKQQSPPSWGVRVLYGGGTLESELASVAPPDQPVANPNAKPNTGIAAAPKASSSGSFGGGISIVTADGQKNNPTAFEVYGMSDGFTRVIDTYGPGDYVELKPVVNSIATGMWQFTVFLGLSGVMFLTWALAKSTYGPITTAAAAVVSSFGGSELRAVLALAALTGFVWWCAVRLTRDYSRIYRASVYTVAFIAMGIIYIAYAATVVPKIVEAPEAAVTYSIAAIDSWTVPGDTEQAYNISVIPTYDGDPMDQALRRYNNHVWLQDDYPAFCQLNFGNVGKATSTIVPDNSDLPAYHKLSLCEYLLKAQTENNTKALDALRSYDSTMGFGGHTGYVQSLAPDTWQFYAGQSPWTRVLYAAIAMFSKLLTTPLNWGLALLVAIMVVLIAIDSILFVLYITAGVFPEFHHKVVDQLRVMSRKILVPAMLAAGIVLFKKILDAFFTIFGGSGWLAVSLIRALCMLFVVVYLVFKLVTWVVRKFQQMLAKDAVEAIGSMPVPDAPGAAAGYTPSPSPIPAAPVYATSSANQKAAAHQYGSSPPSPMPSAGYRWSHGLAA